MDNGSGYLGLANISKGVIVSLLPILLALTSVGILLITAKQWIQIEYRLPGFPQDRYGFTLADRLYWATVDIDYLLNDAGLDYFDDFKLSDGSPMHNARELRHMEDVKNLLKSLWVVWGLGIVLTIILSVVLWRIGGPKEVLRSFQAGAKGVFVLMGILIAGIIVAFGVLFVGFHRIFFEGNTWLFSYADTFIRLYPERFWRDTFVYVAVLTFLQATIISFIARLLLVRLLER